MKIFPEHHKRIKDYIKNCDTAEPERLFTDFPWPNAVQEEVDKIEF